MKLRYLTLAALLLASAPAHAQLADPVRAMIEAAIATGDPEKVAAVVEVAHATNPDDAAEIDALYAGFQTAEAERVAAAAAAKEEAIRTAGLFDNWSGKGQIGAFQSSGNTESIGVTLALDLTRKGIDWTHKFYGDVDYQRTDGDTSREQITASYEPNYRINDRLFAYGLGQYERDRFQGYIARYAISGGLGYKLIEAENMNLSLRAGPAYRIAKATDGTTTRRIAGLVGMDFDWTLAKGLKLTQNTNGTAETGGSAQLIVDSSNTSLKAVTGLEAKINSALTTRLSYTVEYDSNPPAGAVSTDTLGRFTLVYGF